MSVVFDEVIGRVEAGPEGPAEGGQAEERQKEEPSLAAFRRLARRVRQLDRRVQAN